LFFNLPAVFQGFLDFAGQGVFGKGFLQKMDVLVKDTFWGDDVGV